MIEFRQKDFSRIPKDAETKLADKLKTLKKNTKEAAKNPISVAALSVSTLNLANNSYRRKQDKKYQSAQVEATERLTRALEEDARLREGTKAAAKKYRKSVQDVADNSFSAEPVTPSGIMAKFRGKRND